MVPCRPDVNKMHKQFHLYPRKTKKGKVYYVRFYDSFGNRFAGRSTGQTSKAAAENWCQEQLNKGIIPGKASIRFDFFTHEFWDYDRSQYVQARIASGRPLSR
jgi:hypothetical protein